MPTRERKAAELRAAALDYHEFPVPGKVAIAATKQMVNQRDLALAYSPGVAAACEEIAADPANAFRYTAEGWRRGPYVMPTDAIRDDPTVIGSIVDRLLSESVEPTPMLGAPTDYPRG